MTERPYSEQERYEEIVRQFMACRGMLLGYIGAAVPDPHEAEDIFQDVSVVVCSRWYEFDPGTHFTAWVREIARRQVLAHRKKSRRMPQTLPEPALDAIEAVFRARDRSGWWESAWEALRGCMSRLRGAHLRVLTLRYQEDLGTHELATRLGKSVHAVHVTLSRAREALSRCMKATMAR